MRSSNSVVSKVFAAVACIGVFAVGMTGCVNLVTGPKNEHILVIKDKYRGQNGVSTVVAHDYTNKNPNSIFFNFANIFNGKSLADAEELHLQLEVGKSYRCKSIGREALGTPRNLLECAKL